MWYYRNGPEVILINFVMISGKIHYCCCKPLLHYWTKSVTKYFSTDSKHKFEVKWSVRFFLQRKSFLSPLYYQSVVFWHLMKIKISLGCTTIISPLTDSLSWLSADFMIRNNGEDLCNRNISKNFWPLSFNNFKQIRKADLLMFRRRMSWSAG